MAAFMLLLRGVGMAVGGALIWAVFAAVPPWVCGFVIARHSAWWTATDRIKGFVTIRNERLARLLIPEYVGWSSFIQTDIPLFFNRYTINKYPERLSALGAANYAVTALTSLCYWVTVTDFLFFRTLDPNWALWCLFALVGEAAVFFALESWNTSLRREPTVVINRRGMRQIRAARRAKKRRSRHER